LDFIGALASKAKCLQTRVERSADDQEVAAILAPIARSLREYITRPGEDTSKEVGNAVTKFSLAPCPVTAGAFADDPVLRSSAYVRVVAALGLGYAHQYLAAIQLLDQWLVAQSDDHSEAVDFLKIRIRTVIAGFVEEWIALEKQAETTAVLDYHRRNLAMARDLAKRQAFVKTVIRDISGRDSNGLGYEPSQHCDHDRIASAAQELRPAQDERAKLLASAYGKSGAEAERTVLSLIYSLMTVELTYTDTAIKLSDYTSEYYASVDSTLSDVMNIDPTCFDTLRSDIPDLLSAKRLLSAVRVSVAKQTATEPNQMKTLPERQRELQHALEQNRLGLAKIATPARNNRQVRETAESFSARISAGEHEEVYEQLLALGKQVNQMLAAQ
jgi:hypothetical protein